ncbi:C-type mannose receptor 2-like [Sphaeramia orbicularis]|uniref:C-type mannose receptor 2-like n=1 Tax=Sphaeramia orbicularis TaxID=375764 RepID=UPI00117FC9A9|nr:C-type mannose receptor 2-like [Sphaeramia orbicularis]
MQKTWFEAQSFCRKNFTDLATIDHTTHKNKVQSLTQDSGSIAWIGIYDDLRKWTWSHRKEHFNSDQHFNRLQYVALRTSNTLGATITVNGTWLPQIWTLKLPSICYKISDHGSAQYILVEDALTWRQAQNNCRTRYTDLVTVTNSSVNNYITSLISSSSWIGLTKRSWKWSTWSRSTFTNWDMDIPFNSSTHFKCILVNTTTGKWFEGACKDQYHFICHYNFIKPVPKTSKITMKFKFQSEIDLNDPTIQDQITRQLHTKLQKYGLPDSKLHWVQTEKQRVHKNTKKKIKEGPCG